MKVAKVDRAAYFNTADGAGRALGTAQERHARSDLLMWNRLGVTGQFWVGADAPARGRLRQIGADLVLAARRVHDNRPGLLDPSGQRRIGLLVDDLQVEQQERCRRHEQ